MAERRYNVGIVGATGAVGTEIRALLSGSGLSIGELRLLATAESAGTGIAADEPGGEELDVAELTPFALKGLDLVFGAAPAAVALRYLGGTAAQGSVVIDCSAAFRLREDVPLVVPEVNAEALEEHLGIVSSPSGPVAPVALVLDALRELAVPVRLSAVLLLPASSDGVRGMTELADQTVALLNQKDVPLVRFPQRLAFNVIPDVGGFREGAPDSAEELAFAEELRRVLDEPELYIDATALRIPVFSGQAACLDLELKSLVDLNAVRERLSSAAGIELCDDPGDELYPMPSSVSEGDLVQVGRLRISPSDPRRVLVWVVSDNLRKGSALNAVQIAVRLAEDGLLGRH